MMAAISLSKLKGLLVGGGLLFLGLLPVNSIAAGYGSLAGIVSDSKGTPLMGASVLVDGPAAFSADAAGQTLEHIITDARGRFSIAHLVPGWYSLKVSSPTRLPAMRNGIRVAAGETVVASFVLSDTFAPIRFQVPNNSVSSWGDDWKWVLRTSSTTRPILRFRDSSPASQPAEARTKATMPRDERVVGVLPGLTLRDPFAEDFGMASVVAYLKPVSPTADVLVAGSFAPGGGDAGTVGTVLSRNRLKGEPQELGLVIHQFGLVPAASFDSGFTPDSLEQAKVKGMVATFSETRLLARKVTVTAGLDINYLNAIDNVFLAQPHVKLEYQATPQTVLSAQYGSGRAEGSNTLMDRLGMLNAFPQITQRDGRLELAQLNHTEAAVNHRVGRSARVQVAAYHDNLHNAPVWGWGQTSFASGFAANALPNPAGNGVVINGGNYQSTGFRAVYAKNFGSHVEVLGAYASGQALSAMGYSIQGPVERGSQGVWRPMLTHALTGKITADLPGTHTRISSSYEWVPTDRVTLVDPAGQANLQTQPYLGVQIRQPIPTPNFLPVHIDAVAEFQNLLSQGYIPAGQGNPRPVMLSSGYHAIRGGFSVQF